MDRPRRLTLAIVALWLLVGGVGSLADDAAKIPPAADRTIDFARDVAPIFARSCQSCHGPEKQKGGLRLDRAADAIAGGGSGKAFEPGKGASSLLIGYVAGVDPTTVMPPKGPRLTAEEIGTLLAWIDQGANWPEGGKPAKTADASKPGAEHWSFRPVRRPDAPLVKARQWVRNPIDAFVLARLESEGVGPSPEADRATLIRRLSLDLLGLPPSPRDAEEFLRDDRPDAYERLVDRLLASPHFGERWGRHWLDLARYADSDGYEKDSPRPNAYRFRDWVINALNADLPFDRFTVSQIAGDLVPGADHVTKAGTGFHRNTLTNREGGVDAEEYRVKAVVDRVNTTATVWLGLTVGCAQCHTHKYDPILHKEYYGLFAFFNSEKEVDLPGPTSALVEDSKARKTHVLIRGDFLRPGAEVGPGTLAVLPAIKTSRPSRLDLAEWLVDPSNPLTPRVTVNRVWHQLFGRGIVTTLDDFGTRGDLPSHPELLDWLASEIVARGWGQKALIRQIVTSATYRQSSRARPELADRDPLNVWLARQNRLRLEAEVLRDVTLASSGLLATVIGGPSVHPPQASGISDLTYAGSAKWVESKGADRYRRGLYTWFQRTSPYPMLLTFDAPDANVCLVKRERSNTPLQALTLLNDATFVECSRALGRRLASEPTTDTDSRIRDAFLTCLARAPTADERAVLSGLHDVALARFRSLPAEAKALAGTAPGDPGETAAWVTVARAVLNLDEFVNRE